VRGIQDSFQNVNSSDTEAPEVSKPSEEISVHRLLSARLQPPAGHRRETLDNHPLFVCHVDPAPPTQADIQIAHPNRHLLHLKPTVP
jgi:hypothetical protein